MSVAEGLTKAAQETETTQDDEETEDVEYDELPSVRTTPTNVIGGIVEDVFLTEAISRDGDLVNQEGDFRGDIGVTIRNPSVVDGRLFRNEDKPEGGVTSSGVDYYVEPEEGGYIEEINGAPVRSGPQTTVQGEIVDDFEDEVVQVYFSGLTARRLAQVFDAHGKGAFVDNDGEMQNGLIEWHPDYGDGDTRWRYSRYPELRDDIEGEEVLILQTFRKNIDENYDGDAHYAQVFLNDFEGDDVSDATQLEPIRGETEYGSRLRWSDHDVSGDEGEVEVPDDAVGADDDEDLSETEQEVVEAVVEAAEDNGLEFDEVVDPSADEDMVDKVIENNDLSGDVEPDEVREGVKVEMA